VKRTTDDRTDTVGADQQVAIGSNAVSDLQRDVITGHRESRGVTFERNGAQANSIKQGAVERRTQR
jgi:hypothetical protein